MSHSSAPYSLLFAAVALFSFPVLYGIGVGTFLAFGPKLESSFLPVSTSLSFEDIRPADRPGWSIVTLVYYKQRPCLFRNVSWQFVDAVGVKEDVQVPLDIRQSKSRPVGWQRIKDILVGMEPERIESDSVITFYHECHENWLTETPIYPPPRGSRTARARPDPDELVFEDGY